jgi:L,D-transpeptidase catalytic domain
MRHIAVMALGALLCLAAPAKAEVVVNISKSQQRLAVMVDGAETYRWPVSTGRRGHETPAGKFSPVRLERHWYSRQYELTPMPWAMFFHRGYAVHGTMEAYNLGHVASHGCVRLRPDNAAILYSLVRKQGLSNTKVVIMNGPLPALPGTTTTTDAGTPQAIAAEHFAKALRDDNDGDAAKTTHDFSARHDDAVDDVRKQKKSRFAGAYSVSVSSDERQVLREREAWLRSLDRKYGITR